NKNIKQVSVPIIKEKSKKIINIDNKSNSKNVEKRILTTKNKPQTGPKSIDMALSNKCKINLSARDKQVKGKKVASKSKNIFARIGKVLKKITTAVKLPFQNKAQKSSTISRLFGDFTTSVGNIGALIGSFFPSFGIVSLLGTLSGHIIGNDQIVNPLEFEASKYSLIGSVASTALTIVGVPVGLGLLALLGGGGGLAASPIVWALYGIFCAERVVNCLLSPLGSFLGSLIYSSSPKS
ncbi:hypothetical protein ACFL2K_04865, partial [Candidatus Margulisiibacteriota bacterium]